MTTVSNFSRAYIIVFSGAEKINFNQFKVTLGEHDLKQPEIPAARVETIRKATIHPEFKCRFYINDIALLETTNSISWSESIQPACLPLEAGKVGYSAFNGEEAVAAGWGWLGEDKSKGEFFKKKKKKPQIFFRNLFTAKVLASHLESKQKFGISSTLFG